MDQFSADDMALPELKIIQNVGGDNAKAAGAKIGDLYIGLYDQAFPEGLDVVIVDMVKTRTYWGRDTIDDGPPECSSNNADIGKANDGTDCASCSHKCDTPWALSPADRRTKCLLNYNVLTINLTDKNNTPLILRASGISTKPVRELFTILKTNKALKAAGLHRGIVHISSEKKKTASGEAYAYKFKLMGLVENMQEAEALLEASTALLGVDMAELMPATDETKKIELTGQAAPASAEETGKMFEALKSAGAQGEQQVIQKKDVGQVQDLFPAGGSKPTEEIGGKKPPTPPSPLPAFDF
jgi:hypothetical protein